MLHRVPVRTAEADHDPPSSAVRTGRLALTSTAGLVLLAGLGALLVAGLLSAPLVAFDDQLARTVNGVVAPHPWLVVVLSAVTTLGDTVTGVVVVGTAALALLARGRRGPAAFAAVTGLGALALVPAVKGLVGRLRPVVDTPVAYAGGPSFPSGHTVTVTVWVGVLLIVALPAMRPRTRRRAVVAGVVTVVAVGLSRLGLGVHFLSDIVVGWALGVAWLVVTTTAFRAWRGVHGAVADTGVDPSAAGLAPVPAHDPPEQRRRIAARLLVVAVLIVGVLLGVGQLVTVAAAGTAVAAADLGSVRAIAELRTPALDVVSVPAAEAGNTLVIVVGGIVGCVLAVAVLRRLRPAVLLATAVAGETVMFMLVASVTGRARPAVPALDAQLPPTSSFPSGHTAAAVALYGGIAVIVLGATRAWWRWLVVASAVVVVVLVAAARLYRGAHHPSDVLGSLLLTLPWLYALDRLLPRPRPVPAGRPAGPG